MINGNRLNVHNTYIAGGGQTKGEGRVNTLIISVEYMVANKNLGILNPIREVEIMNYSGELKLESTTRSIKQIYTLSPC